MKCLLLLTVSFFLLTTQIVVGQCTKLLDFDGDSNGRGPKGSLISDGTFLYGMTEYGGANNMGTIFKIKPDGTEYLKLLDFDGTSNGSYPQGSLFSDGTFLYGTTYGGGINDIGTIFKIMPDGTGYMKLLDFDGTSNGSNPWGSVITDGTFLYGMTVNGGINDMGTIFKIMPDGTGYLKLFDFECTASGCSPYGSLITDGTFLYGMTSLTGSTYSYGSIFRIMKDGTGYLNLFEFNPKKEGIPKGSLLYEGTFLYGMTSAGTSDAGTIFKIMPDGTDYEKLHDFDGEPNGHSPLGSLISDGNFLYGMTSEGGTNNLGTLFKIKPDGTGYLKLLDFEGTSNGHSPYGDLISDGAFLYGMTKGGGANSMGTVFKFLDITGINEMNVLNKLNVYPNPASDYVTVKREATIDNIMIFNGIGKVVYQQKVNSNKAVINTSTFSNGIYLVKTFGNQHLDYSRLIINR